MTTFENLVQRTARRAARVLAVAVSVGSIGIVATAAPAHAEVPEGWSNPPEVGTLEALLLLAGAPVLLFVVITVAVYLPALARGEKVTPGGTVEDEWFGGPRADRRELTAGTPSDDTGGARGSW